MGVLLNPFAFADNFGDGSQTIPAVVYDGVQGYMLHTGGPTGAADGATLTFVWAGTFNSDGSAMTLLDIPGTVPVKITRQSDNTIDFVGGTAGAVFSNSTTAVAASLGFLIILASCNGTSSTLKVVHAAGTITGTNTTGSASSLDLTADWFLGSDGGASEFLDADTALWWINDAEIDFTDADNIEQFWDTTNDLLRNPGSDGSNPTDGTQPLICHKSAASSHPTNSGTGGDADTAGTFTDGTSPGTYAEDFVPVTTEFAYVTSAKDDSGNSSTSTFSGVSIGDPDDNRVLVVVINSLAALAVPGGSPTVTLGGDAMTERVSAMGQSGNSEGRAHIYTISQSAMSTPSATTADIVVTYSATHRGKAISVYRLAGYTEIPSDTGSATNGNPLSDTITYPDGGVVVAGATMRGDAGECTWSLATRDYHNTLLFSTARVSAASESDVSAGDTAVTATFATSSDINAMACAAFAPA